MRRLLSIVLVALFYAAPVSALLPGGGQQRLPACCRRRGAHHCAMADAVTTTTGAPAFTAPAHCPFYHRSGPATTASFTLVTQPILARFEERAASPAMAERPVLLCSRTHAGRGPPNLL